MTLPGAGYVDLMTLSGDTYHLADYANSMRSWTASPSTINQRVRFAQQVAHRWPAPESVRPTDLTTWLASDDLSAWSRCTYHAHLRSLFGWLAEAGHIDADPTLRVRRPSTPQRRPRPLTRAEQDAALVASSGRLHCWLLLGLYAGFRAHETAKIRGEDVTEEVIYVRGKGGRDEMVPTHPVIWDAATLMWPRHGYWFPGINGRPHVASTTVTNATTRLFRVLGIEGSYHRCRHGYGTNLLRSGTNLRVVQDLMRHRSLATTAGYLGVDADERTEAIRRLAA